MLIFCPILYLLYSKWMLCFSLLNNWQTYLKTLFKPAASHEYFNLVPKFFLFFTKMSSRLGELLDLCFFLMTEHTTLDLARFLLYKNICQKINVQICMFFALNRGLPSLKMFKLPWLISFHFVSSYLFFSGVILKNTHVLFFFSTRQPIQIKEKR